MTATCPTCRKETAPRPGNPSFPFCSERCRLVDLGRWLDEDYRIPGPPAGEPPLRERPGDDEPE